MIKYEFFGTFWKMVKKSWKKLLELKQTPAKHSRYTIFTSSTNFGPFWGVSARAGPPRCTTCAVKFENHRIFQQIINVSKFPVLPSSVKNAHQNARTFFSGSPERTWKNSIMPLRTWKNVEPKMVLKWPNYIVLGSVHQSETRSSRVSQNRTNFLVF